LAPGAEGVPFKREKKEEGRQRKNGRRRGKTP